MRTVVISGGGAGIGLAVAGRVAAAGERGVLLGGERLEVGVLAGHQAGVHAIGEVTAGVGEAMADILALSYSS